MSGVRTVTTQGRGWLGRGTGWGEGREGREPGEALCGISSHYTSPDVITSKRWFKGFQKGSLLFITKPPMDRFTLRPN